MNELYYDMIFKRKSFHRFTGAYVLSQDELQEIHNHIQSLQPLMDNIEVAFQIVPREQTTCKRGEYCILIYSEVKEYYLQNVGYMAQQLDLWLASKNIGACWYGMGKTKETQYHGLDFVIMIAIEKVEAKDFRKDYTKTKRKALSEIWIGSEHPEVVSVVRYAPSACNTQPWRVKCEENKLSLYRVKGKRGMMPQDKVAYYNQIDIGIFMLFLELCLQHENAVYNLRLYSEIPNDNDELLVAIYFLENKTDNMVNSCFYQ